ncbi:carbohydrate ABC transporter permease [Leptolyngbya sp. NIES-3755]|nr:carbohydrate ABC transporter permease [Leptolyngbya sp. NIES-3755]
MLNRTLTYQIGSIALALILTMIIILFAGASPIEVLTEMIAGAFGTPGQFARVIATLAPLLICSCGLLFTFTAGLYNLGIEGQIAFGGIATTFMLRLTQDNLPPAIALFLAILAGGVGGMFWGLFAGVLNIYGRINEIFAGLGLNFLADGLALYLVFGPWKRPGVASMSGTEQFPESLWLPTFGNTDASPIAVLLALISLVITIVVLGRTHFGLKLRAVGQNLRASYVLGIPSVRQLLSSFAICGAFAGIAGAIQVVAVFHRLIPNISSGLGFLALLVTLLAGMNAWLLLPIAFFFSVLNIGSLRLPLDLNLESSLAGVIQGLLVLFVILGKGFSEWKRGAKA